MPRGTTEAVPEKRGEPARTVVGIIPAAGMGTRMRPLSAVVPKEMLPFGRFPLIEHAVAELAASGVEEICVVLGAGKKILKRYLDMRRGSFLPSRIVFAVQKQARGVGDALLSAADIVGHRPFLMVLPDQLVLSQRPASAQLLAAWGGAGELWNSLVHLPPEDEGFFPGARPFRCRGDREGRLVVEDIGSNPDSSPRGFGRTLFPPGAMAYMTADYGNPESGEVDLLLTIRALLKKYPAYGLALEGVPCDFGTWEGYLHYQGRYGGTARAAPPPPGGGRT